MSEEQYKKVIDALVDFVLRVATKNEATTETLTFLAKFRN